MALPACADAARLRTTEIYVAIESVPGTAETFTDADFVEITEDPTLPVPFQKANIDNLSRTSGFGKLPAQLGNLIDQDFTFKTYVYHSPDATTAPHLGQLWEALTGTETIASEVTYSASASSSAMNSMSVLVKTDNLAFSFRGQMTSAPIIMTPTDDSSTHLQVEWSIKIAGWYYYAAGLASGTGSTGPDIVTFTDKGDAARFSDAAILDDAGSPIVVSTDGVDLTAGTVAFDSSPTIGAVSLTPWSPGAPAAPTWSEYQFDAHAINFTIQTTAAETIYEAPMRDMSFLWDNDLSFRNNETGGIGRTCVNRVNVRNIVNTVNTIQNPDQAAWNTAAADNRDVTVVIVATAADGTGRTFTINQGTNGVAKIRQTGTGTEDGLITGTYDIMYNDSVGGDDEAEFEFA